MMSQQFSFPFVFPFVSDQTKECLDILQDCCFAGCYSRPINSPHIPACSQPNMVKALGEVGWKILANSMLPGIILTQWKSKESGYLCDIAKKD